MGRCKRLVCLLVLICCAFPARPVRAEDAIYVMVDGISVDSVAGQPEGASSYFANGRLMVPVAAFAQAMGARVEWDSATRDVFVYLYGRYAWLQISNPTLYHGAYQLDDDGDTLLTGVTAIALDVRPELVRGRAFAPMYALLDALGGQAVWDGETRTASITPPPYASEPVREDTTPDENDTQAENNATQADKVQPDDSCFKLLAVTEVLCKYEADEPFVLVCFDNARHAPQLKEVLKAAADLRLRIYGLDAAARQNAALPFTQDGVEDMYLYFIAGFDRVETLTNPDYTTVYDALRVYWAAN